MQNRPSSSGTAPAMALNESHGHPAILSCAVMNCPVTVVITDSEGTIEYVNRKFSEVTGYPPSETLGRKASLLKSGTMPPRTYQELWDRLDQGHDWIGEFENRKKDGTLYWEKATISPVRDSDGRIRHYLKIAEDITLQKKLKAELMAANEALKARESELSATCRELTKTARSLEKNQRKLQRMSHEDALTGLLNRHGFYHELKRVKARSERSEEGIGILIADIDHFKQVNDRYGHIAGDKILKSTARLFLDNLRADDLVCRFGGDEILVVLPAADPETTRRAAERLLLAVRRHTVTVGRNRIVITVSIGATCGQSGGNAIAKVIQQADHALYRVKNDGRDAMAFWESPCPRESSMKGSP